MAENKPSAKVIKEYEVAELTDAQKERIQATMKSLDDNKVTDRFVQGKIMAQHKSYLMKLAVCGINSDVL